jgi:catabolite regulation protein CreA
MWYPREELLQLMGMDDTQWRDALYLRDMLLSLQQQREYDIDEKNTNERRTGYYYAAQSMFLFTFQGTIGSFYDAKRKTLWYLGWRVSL